MVVPEHVVDGVEVGLVPLVRLGVRHELHLHDPPGIQRATASWGQPYLPKPRRVGLQHAHTLSIQSMLPHPFMMTRTALIIGGKLSAAHPPLTPAPLLDCCHFLSSSNHHTRLLALSWGCDSLAVVTCDT